MMSGHAYSDPTAWMAIGRVIREEKRKRRREHEREFPSAERRDRNTGCTETTNKEAEQK
jgi:hypothetical protein